MPPDATADDQDFARRMRRTYLERREQVTARIRECLEAVHATPADADALRALHTAVHTVKGNGGTYGFPEVTAWGERVLERIAAAERTGGPAPAELDRWRRALAALDDHLDGADPDDPAAGRPDGAPSDLESTLDALFGPRTPADVGDGGHTGEATRAAAPDGTGAGAAAGVVLVVDDSADLRFLLERGLGRRGWTVHAVRTAAEATAALADGLRPDVVLVDNNLPDGVKGPEAARDLRDAGVGDVPLVLMSAELPDEIDRDLFADAVAKPLELAALAEHLAELLAAGGETSA